MLEGFYGRENFEERGAVFGREAVGGDALVDDCQRRAERVFAGEGGRGEDARLGADFGKLPPVFRARFRSDGGELAEGGEASGGFARNQRGGGERKGDGKAAFHLLKIFSACLVVVSSSSQSVFAGEGSAA